MTNTRPDLLALIIVLLATTAWSQTLSEPYQQGLKLAAEAKHKEAAEAFARACKLKPDNAEAFYELGQAYRNSEQLPAAIKAYQQAMKLKPKWFAATYGLGVAYGMAGSPNDAVTFLKEAIVLKPDSDGAFYNLGVAHADLGHDAEAAAAFRKATELNPKDPDYFFNLGVTYQNLKQSKEAEEALAQTLVLKPEDAQAHYQIGLLYLDMGNPGFATVHYLALIKSNPQLAAKFRPRLFPLTSVLEKRVTFALPLEWQVQKSEDTKTVGRVQLFIPYLASENTPDSANASVAANPVPGTVTVKELGDGVYKRPFADLKVVNDIGDGPNWRTLVWTAKMGETQYVGLDRFGVVDKIGVEFMVAFPLLKDGDPKWIEKVVQDFNAVCGSLKIDGTNSTGAKVHLGKLP